MSPRLEARDLRLRYPGNAHDTLRGVSFTLEGPGIYGLLGRNGSGKTSLLSLLAGFRRAEGGSVRVDGRPVFENPRILPHLTLIRGSGDSVELNWPRNRVGDALKLAADLRPNWDGAYAEKLCERFHLEKGAPLGKMSTGQRSALGCVLGLAARAPITMLDETYLGMDAPSRYAFYDALLTDYMEHPRILLVSSHLVEELGPLLERVLLIHEGRLLVDSDADALRARGTALTGPEEAVGEFITGRRVLNERRLGRTRQAVVDGELGEQERLHAAEAGVELGPVPLQDLFIHLTEEEAQ